MRRIAVALALALPIAPLQAQGTTFENAPRFERSAFDSLVFLIGRWHGTGGGGLASTPRFYEEYSRRDDSTFTQRTFTDSSFRVVSDSARIELRAGRVIWRQELGAPMHAVEVGPGMVVFGQGSGAPITIRRETPNSWRVTIPSGPGGAPSFYAMQRMGVPARRNERQ